MSDDRYKYAPDLDELTAIIAGLADYLETVQYLPGKTIPVINHPTATRDQALDHPPVLWIEFENAEWEDGAPNLIEDSRIGNCVLYRTGEFRARMIIVIMADSGTSRSKAMLAIRAALEPDIVQQSDSEIRIPLPRYFGGYAPSRVRDKGALRGTVAGSGLQNTVETIEAGVYNGFVKFDVELPIYKAARLVEGVPELIATVPGEED